MPRLPSEYFAARAQSAGCSSAKAIDDVATTNARIDQMLRRDIKWNGQVGEVCVAGSLAAGAGGRGATGR